MKWSVSEQEKKMLSVIGNLIAIIKVQHRCIITLPLYIEFLQYIKQRNQGTGLRQYNKK